MEKLQLPAVAKTGSPISRPGSGSAVARKPLPDRLPRISNQATDINIPRSVWSSWSEAGKDRKIRRELTADERSQLEARRDELEPFVGAFDGREQDAVALAVIDMYGAYPSMRANSEDAGVRVDSVLRLLAEFPAWAIEGACKKIQMNGVWRESKYDLQWPPSDAELARDVRIEYRLYGDTYKQVVALLQAEVEK